MAETGFSSFNTTVDKTNHVLREIEKAYHWPKELRHFKAEGVEALTRTVLHSLRLHITDGEWEDIKFSVPKDIAAVLT